MLALLAAPGAAVVAEPTASYPEIEYASPDQSVWTSKIDEKGDPANPLFRFADILFAKAGIPWHGKTYPSARMFRYLQDGTAQFSMLVKAPVLQACCLWSRKPVASVDIKVYRFSSKPPIKAPEDFVGKSVILVRGYSYAGLKDFVTDTKNRIASSEAPTHQAAFRMLALGRADYLVDYAGPAAEILATEPVAGVVSDLLSRQEVHMVLSRTYPDAEKVMSRLEAIAEAIDKEQIGKTSTK